MAKSIQKKGGGRMDELQAQVARVVQAGPHKMVLSAPRPGAAARRATVLPVGGGWQVERRTATQAFHENLPGEGLAAALCGLLREEFTQLTAQTAQGEFRLRVTKKGKVLVGRTAGAAAPPATLAAHNRQKKYLLPEGEVVPALVDLGVFTADGRVVAAMYEKYRQINRFVELVDDVLRQNPNPPETLRVVDFGCGKSYLTFVLYHYLTAVRGMRADVTGLDLKADVVAKCNAAARRYGYEGLRFAVGDIAAWQGPPADMVVALHACDTATDYALAGAVAMGAKYIFSVPCCQHELNGQLHSEELAILGRYGIVKERAAALFTDAIRANLLAACGYKTQLVEFVDFAHTPKNILIRAVKAPLPAAKRTEALDEVRRLAAAFGLQPTLLALLKDRLPK